MEKKQIERCLGLLNDALAKLDVRGEVCLYGGAVMCLVYGARPSTKDVDGIFQPTSILREAIAKIGHEHGLAPDWLNDAVKGFVVGHPKHLFLELSHLRVFVPEPDYLLAMKALSARADGTDRDDIKYLIRQLGLKGAEDVFSILKQYYPNEQVRPATQFFVQELFDQT